MTLRRLGFTFVELMIVIAIIGILGTALFPQMTAYYARGRDTARISDIKSLSTIFQNYSRTNSTYPSNTNKDGDTSYCISDMSSWEDAQTQFKDKQYSQLGGTGALKSDPMANNINIGLCNQTGSYLYARLQKETSYGVLAARMERQTTGANYASPLRLTQSAYIDEMMRAQPLDKNGNDDDKIFLIITN